MTAVCDFHGTSFPESALLFQKMRALLYKPPQFLPHLPAAGERLGVTISPERCESDGSTYVCCADVWETCSRVVGGVRRPAPNKGQVAIADAAGCRIDFEWSAGS